jgi:hypothetical protein
MKMMVSRRNLQFNMALNHEDLKISTGFFNDAFKCFDYTASNDRKNSE